MRSYLARRDIRQELFVAIPRTPQFSAAPLQPNSEGRAKSAEMECKTLFAEGWRPPEVQGMINGMALGVRHETEEDIEEPFQQTGTLHLFAVAGLHVGIVARLL